MTFLKVKVHSFVCLLVVTPKKQKYSKFIEKHLPSFKKLFYRYIILNLFFQKSFRDYFFYLNLNIDMFNLNCDIF